MQEWNPEKYAEGDDVPIRIDVLHINGDEVLEINFSGFFSKQRISNVMIYYPKKIQSDSESVSTNYTGRIKHIKMDKGCFSFRLLLVSTMDSGNYTVFQNSLEKGNTSILVSRRVLFRQDLGSMILPFKFNKANMSLITIEMINPLPLAVVIYDVELQRCKHMGYPYQNRTESCAFNASNFTFTLHNVSWLDKGTYVAWDDRRFLLDSIDLDIQEGSKFSSQEASNVYITLPSAATEPADSWKVVQGRGLDLTTHTEPDNANVHFDSNETEGNMRLEINLFGYSVKLRLTTMMLNDPITDQNDGRSLNRNDTGQIEMILKDKNSLSFQLLNASFEGINELEKSCDKGNAIINVKRSRFVQQGEKSRKPPCLYNETDISSNTNNKVQTNVTSLAISSNVTNEIPTDVAQSYRARIEDCTFSRNNVSFTFQESPWLENATFAACDDNGFILQSICIEVQSSNEDTILSYGPSSTHGPSSSNENSVWLWISTVFVVAMALCLTICAYRLFRRSRAREVPTSETNGVMYKNRRKLTANGLRNLYINGNDTDTSEQSRMFSSKNQSSENRINITTNKIQAMSIPGHVNRLPTTKSTVSIGEPCFEYDYVVHHSFMTLRPPAPDPYTVMKPAPDPFTVMKPVPDPYTIMELASDPYKIMKHKEEVAMAESISCYKRKPERSSSTLHLPTVYSNVNTKRSRSSYCIVSLSDAENRNVINDLASPGYFDLENIHGTNIIMSSCRLSYCGGRNKENAENMDSNVLAKEQR
ncbi:hypothetical protein ACJMK2_024929 [Sinanodonta woodiana]|uniref:CUB domain-containing protein n=1 Tax=Sinanodonta woodiana TaxID=1069815 RepID=A0ABD3XIN0_SINWO